MKSEEIAQSYDTLASHWNSDNLNRENGVEQHKRACRFAKSKRTAIDIGCGSSGRIMDLLISEGYETEGLDISPEMIRLATIRSPDQSFHHADIRTWDFPKQYDFISAWDSIWHAPLEDHEHILKKLCRGLTAGGVLIFTCGGLDEPGSGSNRFLGQPLYHATLGIPNLLNTVSQCSSVCRHLEYDQFPEKHVYLIVQRSE